jgi:EmrB/QacA subfamily drug resistance transporter
MAPQTVESAFERFGPNYRWLVTGTGLVGMIAMVLASTSVNVTVPEVMGAFGIGQDRAQWMASGYFAATTATMLTNAWLVSVIGRRATFIIAVVIFILAAALGGLATNYEMIIVSRVLQGACAGVVQPLSMATIFLVFPAERRGRAMGLFGLGVVLAPAFGPFLGGIVADIFSWRYVFFLPVPFCLVALLAGSIFMPDRDSDKPKASFDWTGIVLLSLALGCLLNGLASGQREGWTSNLIVIQLSVGVASAIAFVLWQLRAQEPLLDMSLFTNPQFSSAAVVAFIFGFGMFGSIYIIVVFVQTVQGFTPLRAGLVLIPGGLMMTMIFPLAGRVVDSVPAHLPIMFGLIFFGCGFLLMSGSDVNTPFWTFVGFTLVNRFGLSWIIPSLNTGALRSLTPEQVYQGSGMINFCRMLGGACGVNILVVFMEMRTRLYSDALTATQTFGNQTSRGLLGSVERLLAESGLPESQQSAGAIHYLGQMVHAQANTFGFQETFMVSAAVAFLALVPAYIMGRARTPRLPALGGPPAGPGGPDRSRLPAR